MAWCKSFKADKGCEDDQMRCKFCHKIFDSSDKKKKYCDKICHTAARKAEHNRYTLMLYRKKEGVYQKWIDELEKIGYVVLPPTKMRIPA